MEGRNPTISLTPASSGTQITIDPVEYGRLIQTVINLENRLSSVESTFAAKVGALEKDIGELLALANKGRGAFWAGLTLASVVSGIAGYAVHLFTFHAPK